MCIAGLSGAMAKRRNQKPTKAPKVNKGKKKPSGEGSFSRPKRKAQSGGEPPAAKRFKKNQAAKPAGNEGANGSGMGGDRKGFGAGKKEWRKKGGKVALGASKVMGKGSKKFGKGGKSPTGGHGVRQAEGDLRLKKSEVKARIREHKSLIKKNFGLVQEVVFLWEKLRPSNVTPAQKGKLVTMILGKIKGKIPELVKNHRASRVVQFCLKEGSDLQRKEIMQEVQQNMIELSKDKYGRHLVLKLVNCLPEEHVGALVKTFRGRIMTLLRHGYGTDVVADLYHCATKDDKISMQLECYSTELSLQQQILFEHKKPSDCGMSLRSIISDLDQIRRASIFRDLTDNLNYLLEKGLLHPRLVHILIKEYLLTAKSVLVEDLVKALADTGDGIMKMLHTKEGSASAVMVLAYGNSKIRKAVIKGLKGYVKEVACDEWGHAVLITALRVVDDTALLNKIIVQEIKGNLVDVCRDRYGSRVVLSILNPEVVNSMPEEIVEILSPKEQRVTSKKRKEREPEEEGSGEEEREEEEQEDEEEEVRVLGLSLKDPADRLESIWTDGPGSLLDCLLELCIADGAMLLNSQFGSNIWFEIASGGGSPFTALVQKKKLTPVYDCILKACLEPIGGNDSHKMETVQVENAAESHSEDESEEDQPESGSRKSPESCDEEDLQDDIEVLPDEFEADDEGLEVFDDSDKEEGEPMNEPDVKPEKIVKPSRKNQKASKINSVHILKSRSAQYALQRLIGLPSNSEKGKFSVVFIKKLWESVFAGRCQKFIGSPGELVLVSMVDCEVEDVRRRARDEIESAIDSSVEEWAAPLKKIQCAQKLDMWKKVKRKKKKKAQKEIESKSQL